MHPERVIVTDDGRATPRVERPGVERPRGESPSAHLPDFAAAEQSAQTEPAKEKEWWGNGLTGLRERLAPFSATLSAGPTRPHGFRLSATLPVR